MKFSTKRNNYLRLRTIILLSGLAFALLIAANILERKETKNTLTRDTQKKKAFLQRKDSPKQTDHSWSKQALSNSESSRHMLHAGRRRRGRGRGAIGGSRPKTAAESLASKTPEQRDIYMKGYEKFKLNGVTYYLAKDKIKCGYFNAKGMLVWEYAVAVKLYKVEVIISGIKYFCKEKTEGDQECFFFDRGLMKVRVLRKNIRTLEFKTFTFGDKEFIVYIMNKAQSDAYYVKNNQREYLPKKQVQYILSDNKDNSFVSDDGVTYYYVDELKNRCWTVIDGERKEFSVKDVKGGST